MMTNTLKISNIIKVAATTTVLASTYFYFRPFEKSAEETTINYEHSNNLMPFIPLSMIKKDSNNGAQKFKEVLDLIKSGGFHVQQDALLEGSEELARQKNRELSYKIKAKLKEGFDPFLEIDGQTILKIAADLKLCGVLSHQHYELKRSVQEIEENNDIVAQYYNTLTSSTSGTTATSSSTTGIQHTTTAGIHTPQGIYYTSTTTGTTGATSTTGIQYTTTGTSGTTSETAYQYACKKSLGEHISHMFHCLINGTIDYLEDGL